MDNVTTSPTKRPPGKPKGRHPHKRLSAAFVRSAPPGRYCDGNGLYLYVQKTGTRSWIQRLVIRGRKRELGLGSVALVPLAEARDKALANRKLARDGGDPLAEKRRSAGIPTFAEAAKRVLEQKRAGWRSAEHVKSWPRSLKLHAFPAHRAGARLGGDERRRAGDPHPPLAHQGSHGPARSHAGPRGDGMGHRHGLADGQPPATGSSTCWVPSTMLFGIIRPCLTGKSRRPSRSCGRRIRDWWTRSRSSCWC